MTTAIIAALLLAAPAALLAVVWHRLNERERAARAVAIQRALDERAAVREREVREYRMLASTRRLAEKVAQDAERRSHLVSGWDYPV